MYVIILFTHGAPRSSHWNLEILVSEERGNRSTGLEKNLMEQIRELNSTNSTHIHCTVLSIGPGTCRSSSGHSGESHRGLYLTFKNSPERNSPGLRILLQGLLFRDSHLLIEILLKALTYDTGSENQTRDTLVGGECSHHCTIPAPLQNVSSITNAQCYIH